jgi:hydroxymethylglutaryl-CoA lyase
MEIIEKFYYSGSHVKVIICDTTNLATPRKVSDLFRTLLMRGFLPGRFGVHFHGQGQEVLDKIQAAVELGVKDIDTSLEGFGGCPSAKKNQSKNLSNAPTEQVVSWLHEKGYVTGINLNRVLMAREYLNKEMSEHPQPMNIIKIGY